MIRSSAQVDRRHLFLGREAVRFVVPALLTTALLSVVAGAPAYATTPRITKPGAPTGVLAAPGNGSALVSWTAPASDGGSPITGYTVTASHGGATCTTSGATDCTVTGLANRYLYTFRVRASNGEGNGPAGRVQASMLPVVAIGGVNTFYNSEPIDVTLSEPSLVTVRVDFAISDGAPIQLFWAAWADAPASFHPGSGTITFVPGQTLATLSFSVDPTGVSGCWIQSVELGLPCYPDAELTLTSATHAVLEPTPEAGLVYLP